MIKWETHQEMS